MKKKIFKCIETLEITQCLFKMYRNSWDNSMFNYKKFKNNIEIFKKSIKNQLIQYKIITKVYKYTIYNYSNYPKMAKLKDQ